MIRETIRNLTLEREKNVHIQDVIDELQDFIVDSNPGTKSFDIAYQNKWVERILLCADMENVPVVGSRLVIYFYYAIKEKIVIFTLLSIILVPGKTELEEH